MEPEFEPILPPAVAASQTTASAAGSSATNPTADTSAATPANRVGEPIDRASTTSSSRPKRDRWLAGVLAASLLSASVASVATVGVLVGSGRLDQGASGAAAITTASTAPGSPSATTSPAAVTITASDAVVAVAEKASPAVVTITVESAGNGRFGPMSLPSTGVGSGFVFDASGLILTNHHVIQGSGSITVTFEDGTEMTGTVVADDPTKDLAVVKVEATGLPTIAIGDSTNLEVGQLLVAIGSPLGTFSETVTSGILSATGRTIDVGSAYSRQSARMTGLLQTDAAINEGNSGGPLMDANGDVVGVNVAVATSAQGIGFAIPINEATDIMAQARAATNAA